MAMSTELSVSVVLRNRNEERLLRRVLQALARQRLRPIDIVMVDNASTDGSRDLCAASGVTIVDLPREQFTYGRALNRGIAAARGDLAVLLSAHSLPMGRHFLTDCRTPFADPRVAAARCLHLKKTRELEAWMEDGELAWPADLDAVIARGPLANGCVIRRSVWEQLPFDEILESAEDKVWGLEALKRGHTIAKSDAMYLYMRQWSAVEDVRMQTRANRAVFRVSGRRPKASLVALAKTCLWGAPKTAATIAATEVMRYVCFKSIPLQARWPSRQGSWR